MFHAWARCRSSRTAPSPASIFESKEGRRADPRIGHHRLHRRRRHLPRAGAASAADIDTRDIHHCINTALMFGGVDMPRWTGLQDRANPISSRAFMDRGREACGGLFERPFVSWRNDVALFMGPRLAGYSAVDVEDLTEVEIRSHRLMAAHLAVYRDQAPGFEDAFLMLSAPQFGVRHARRLVGTARVPREDWERHAAAGRDRRLAVIVAEIPADVGALWRAGPRDAGRAAGHRAGNLLRRHEPLLHARNPAMLDDRPGRRRGGVVGCECRRAAARGAVAGASERAAAARGIVARRGRAGTRPCR